MRFEHQYDESGRHRLVMIPAFAPAVEGEWAVYQHPAFVQNPQGPRYMVATAYWEPTFEPTQVYEVFARPYQTATSVEVETHSLV